MIKALYSSVMDPDVNALWRLPKVIRFQYMSMLAFMWSAVFSLWTGWISLFGPSALAHAVLLIGVFFTADLFRRASRSPAHVQYAHHRDAMRNKKDGTVLYDDLWGAP